MNSTAVKTKLLHLQAQLDLMRKTVTQRPDFSVDEAIWKKIRPEAKKARRNIWRGLYGKK